MRALDTVALVALLAGPLTACGYDADEEQRKIEAARRLPDGGLARGDDGSTGPYDPSDPSTWAPEPDDADGGYTRTEGSGANDFKGGGNGGGKGGGKGGGRP